MYLDASKSLYVIAPMYQIEDGNAFIENEGILLVTTLFTTIVWLIVTFITKPTDKEKLLSFYHKVKPDGAWNPIKQLTNYKEEKSNLPYLVVC